MGNKSALQLEVEKEMGFEIDEDLFAYLEHYARRKLEVANKSAGRAWGEDGYGDEYLSLLIPDVIREMAFSASGQKIDVFFNNHEDALHFGRQEIRIKVISDTER